MLTKLVIVPDGPESIDKRIEIEIRKEHSVKEYEIKGHQPVKEPHLVTKSGKPYWVTLWEPMKS